MDQQMLHHLTAVPKADITAEVFRTTYPDVSLQPVGKSTNNDTAKTSNVQHYQVVSAAAEEEAEGEDEDEDDGVGENIQYVQSQQVTTLPLIYQKHHQTTIVPKTVPLHIGLPVQTTHQIPQQIRLQQNGVIIQPQQMVYTTRYTTSNGQVILQPDNTPTQAVQTVVVSNAVVESSTPVKQFVGQIEEGKVDGQQTINCSIQCVNTPRKPQANVQQWGQQQQLSREKSKSTNITTISASSAASVVAAVAKAKRGQQKVNKPSLVKRKASVEREKPTNVVLPMYSTTKGQVITALPKLQTSQTTVSTGTTNVSQQLVQALQPIPPPPPPPPAIQMNSVVPVNEPSTQILIIMPDKTKRMFILNQQNKDYKIQDLVTELGVSPNDITINFKIGSQTASDEDLDEENQREEEEMALPEAEEEVSSQGPQDDQGEEESVEEFFRTLDGDDSKKPKNEPPKFKTGLLAVCNACGYSSVDFNRCQRCTRKFPPNVRSVPASSVMTSFGDSSQKGGRKTKCDSSLEAESPRKKSKGGRKKRLEEPVCLTISDDEEGGGHSSHHSSQISPPRVEPVFVTDPVANLSATQKEPVITEDPSNEEGASTAEPADESFPDEEVENECTRLHCRTVRIGSYKVVPHDKVLLSPLGVKIHVPALDETPVTVTILFHEIVRVLISFHKSLPVLFFYTNSTAAMRIREILKMDDQDGQYYNPASKVDAHRRITLLPVILDEDNRLFLKQLFGNSQQKHKKQLLYELNSKEANDILVRASPKDVQETLGKGNALIGVTQLPPPTFNGGIHTIMVYPPPPTKGGIPINTEDYACLGEDQFLNDVIIDFYLKYLVLTQLSQADQARTHVFSSFFYKRLTTRPSKATRRSYHPIEDDANIPPAVKRHSRVKSWTKAVDLFSKDFIIIPINENCHWYLAIICFPGLKGPVRISDNQPISVPDKKKKDGKLDSDVTGVTAKVLTGKKAITIGSTTITAVVNTPTVNETVTLDAGGEEEDRDEADGDDEDMESNHSSDNESDVSIKSKASTAEEAKEAPPPEQEEKKPKRVKREREPIKQPCILIFDSLAGGSRARVVATLRDYLRIEYKVKHKGEERDFSKDVMKGASPKVPQQTNFTDCGLYLLQYVEAFFQMPVKDYHIPIKELLNWFTADLVSQKRYQIQQLLHLLMEEQKIDIESLNLPNLRLKDGSHKSQLVDYSCSEDEEMEEEEEEDEHMDGELGEQDEMLDGEIVEEEELCEEELEEQMCEEGLCEDGLGEMCEEEEEEYLEGEEEEELSVDEEEELDDGEINPDDIPESVKREFDLKSVRIQRVIPMKQDSLSPRKRHRADDK